jgi:hypothetical protein
MNAPDFRPKAILWNETDFQADRIVQRMTPRQRAMYRCLLMEAYFGSHAPYLRAGDPDMWYLADADNPQQWEENKAAVLVKFTEVVDRETGERLLENKRVSREWDLTWERLQQRKAAGAASAEKRRGRILKKGETLTTVSKSLTTVNEASNDRSPENPPPPPKVKVKVKLKEKEKEKEKGRSTLVSKSLTTVKTGDSERPTQTTLPSVSPNDLTLTNPETVADFIQIPDNASLEEIVNKISDGEYGINSLDQYDCASELEKACRQAVREKTTSPFFGKETCAAIMSRAMEILRVQSGLDTPPPWLPVLKSLRSKKGPATSLRSKKEILEQRSGQVLTDPSSAFHWYIAELKPFEPLLIATAKTSQAPADWGEAVQFLNEVVQQNPNTDLSGLLLVRDRIQARVAPAA